MPKKEYRVFVSYPSNLFGSGMDEAIEKAAGVDCDGSGAGCGSRDMDFTFTTQSTADNAVQRIKRVHRDIEAHSQGVIVHAQND